MRDPHTKPRPYFPPPRVAEEKPSTGVFLFAAFFVMLIGIFAIAGLLWVGLNLIDVTTSLSFGDLVVIASVYMLVRTLDRTLFGIRLPE